MSAQKANYTQEERKKTLKRVAEHLNQAGGFSLLSLAGGIPDFERFLCFEIGCSLKIAKDYIAVLRGAMIHKQRLKDLKEEQKNAEG